MERCVCSIIQFCKVNRKRALYVCVCVCLYIHVWVGIYVHVCVCCTHMYVLFQLTLALLSRNCEQQGLGVFMTSALCILVHSHQLCLLKAHIDYDIESFNGRSYWIGVEHTHIL